ncbi:MAG: hypothetical protein WBW55_06010 [Desulfobaccales bacterium]
MDNWPFFLFCVGTGLQMSGWTNIYIATIFWVAAAILLLYETREWISRRLGWLRRMIPTQVVNFIKKRYIFCSFLMACVAIAVIDSGIYIYGSHERPPMVIAQLHGTISSITAKMGATTSGPSVFRRIIGYAFWAGAVILLLVGVKRRRWPFRKKVTINKKQLLQDLYDELDSIAKDKWVNYNYQSIRPAIDQLPEWKDKAKKILSKVFGQEELNNFIDKIRYVDEKDEYRNPNIGMIEAFYNEKETYLKYLKDLLDSLESYPELWS